MLPALTMRDTRESLDDAIRFSYGVMDNFSLLFMSKADALTNEARRRRYARCEKVAIAGFRDGTGLDIQGQWDDLQFWAAVRAFAPTCIVVDVGSESFLSPFAIQQLRSTVEELDAILMISLYRDMPNFYEFFSLDSWRHFQATRYDKLEVLFTFWSRLPEASMWPSEVINLVTSRWAADNFTAHEVRQQYAAIGALKNYASFDDAVDAQIRMFTECGVAAEKV